MQRRWLLVGLLLVVKLTTVRMALGQEARGYQTAAAVDTLWLTPKFRVDQGFDLYDMEAAHTGLDDPYRGIRLIVDRFENWLDDDTTQWRAPP